jgi:hypothetical protein
MNNLKDGIIAVLLFPVVLGIASFVGRVILDNMAKQEIKTAFIKTGKISLAAWLTMPLFCLKIKRSAKR